MDKDSHIHKVNGQRFSYSQGKWTKTICLRTLTRGRGYAIQTLCSGPIIMQHISKATVSGSSRQRQRRQTAAICGWALSLLPRAVPHCCILGTEQAVHLGRQSKRPDGVNFWFSRFLCTCFEVCDINLALFSSLVEGEQRRA